LVGTDASAGVTMWRRHIGTGQWTEENFSACLRPAHFCQAFLLTASHKAKWDL